MDLTSCILIFLKTIKLFKMSDELKTEAGFQNDDVNCFSSDKL